VGWFTGWFRYSLGAGAAKTIFGETNAAPGIPFPSKTEAEIRADELRYDEDEKRLDATDAAAKKHGRA
jgi:hypothetical protein